MTDITRRQSLARMLEKGLEVAAGAALLLPSQSRAQEIIYTPEHLLKREFDQKEAQWRENVINYTNNRPLIDYTSIPLSPEFDMNDLIASLGGEWDAMPQSRKDTTYRSWSRTGLNSRRTICTINQNPFRYFKERLTQEQQDQFNEFNAAFLKAMKNYASPSSQIFATRDGSTTSYFARHHPWIWLDIATVPGRIVLFRQGYIDNPQQVRLNFPNIQKLAEQAFLERDAEITRGLRQQ